ncbi:hypothetical protein Tdes44962_MAKER09363 [Teratosphaeria destructans]|uniref:Small secreted protein n=1 Tax=Teratosphaeria destructans TaxID=418781 RepID=A0A9W7STT3_9PEZI|nr:hypothetical protein Tdes44962_MAKER09363 [Teratosphaeria destructans]
MLLLPTVLLANYAIATNFIAHKGTCDNRGDQVGNLAFTAIADPEEADSYDSGCFTIDGTVAGHSVAFYYKPPNYAASSCSGYAYHDNQCSKGEQAYAITGRTVCWDYNGVWSMKVKC